MTIPSNEEMIQIAMTPPSREGDEGSPNDSSWPSARASPQGRRAFPSDQEASTSIRKSPGGGGKIKRRRTRRTSAAQPEHCSGLLVTLILDSRDSGRPRLARMRRRGPDRG